LFTKFKKHTKSVFLDPNSPPFHLREKVNIILSPSLYWVAKVTLPVKYLRDVKKLLPSLFEDTLPAGDYSYTAYKSGDAFFIFAYQDQCILDILAEKKIALLHVANIYFAQSELGHIPSPVKINASQSIYVKDEILLLVPSSWVSKSVDLDISEVKLSRHKVTLAQFGHNIDNKILKKIAIVMSAILLLTATEYLITAQKLARITESKETLFAKYNLHSTMIQNQSILKKYDSLHTNQMKLRTSIASILTLELEPSQRLSQLKYKNNVLEAEFSGVEKGKESRINEVLKTKNIDFKSSFKDKFWYVEISL